MKALNYLMAFIGGAAIGAAAGLLLAPEKGSELREKIAEALRKRGMAEDFSWARSAKKYREIYDSICK